MNTLATETERIELEHLYCPARKSLYDGFPDVCDVDGDNHICWLELGRPCELRMQLIKEEKEG
jgi:hypothetical protein